MRLSPPIVQTKVRSDYTPNVNTKVRVVVYYYYEYFSPKNIFIFRKWTKVDLVREGFQVQMLPKFRHCLNGGGGSDPCLDFCEGFVHMH